MTREFVAGVVGAPFGLKGFVKVKVFSGETGHLLRLKAATLRQDGRVRELAVAESSAVAPGLVMRFEGYGSPEAARSLTGAELLVSREGAAPLRPGEFYVEDLKGLAVVSGDEGEGAGVAIGRISSIIEGGGGDLAEIELADGTRRLAPFREEFFPAAGIDIEGGRATLRNAWVLE